MKMWRETSRQIILVTLTQLGASEGAPHPHPVSFADVLFGNESFFSCFKNIHLFTNSNGWLYIFPIQKILGTVVSS